MQHTILGKHFILGLTAALTLSAMATTTFAADTVTQSVTGDTRTATVADLTLGAVTYEHAAQTSSGSMTLSADDSTGSGAGWSVSILASDFIYSGSSGGTNIPAANFAVTSADAPTVTTGQAIDATAGPKVPATSPVGTLDSARTTVQADAGFGQGTYAQDLGVSLTVPAQSREGTYTATLTTTIAAAP